MKYFLHSSTSFTDDKICQLYLKFGYEGIGLYYTAIEKLSFQEKPINTQVLKSQLNVGKKLSKCWEFMESLGILSTKNGETSSKELTKYLQTYSEKREKNTKKILQWRENQQDTKNVTSYEPVRNPTKVNKSKVKESKEDIGISSVPKSDRFLAFEKWIKENASSVAEMKEPFTEPEFEKIRTAHNFEKISEILQAMHNWMGLSEKKSAYLTFLTFSKNNIKREEEQPKVPTTHPPPDQTLSHHQRLIQEQNERVRKAQQAEAEYDLRTKKG